MTKDSEKWLNLFLAVEDIEKIKKSFNNLTTEMLHQKIINLHNELNKKVEKNKNQALEITKLIEQKKDLQTIANVSQIKLHTIEEQIKKAYLDRDFAIAFNQKLKDENRILKDKNSYQVHRIENLEAQLDSKDTIVSYLEGKLK